MRWIIGRLGVILINVVFVMAVVAVGYPIRWLLIGWWSAGITLVARKAIYEKPAWFHDNDLAALMILLYAAIWPKYVVERRQLGLWRAQAKGLAAFGRDLAWIYLWQIVGWLIIALVAIIRSPISLYWYLRQWRRAPEPSFEKGTANAL